MVVYIYALILVLSIKCHHLSIQVLAKNHQSHPSARTPANSSKYFLSTSSNPFSSVQSISIIATVYTYPKLAHHPPTPTPEKEKLTSPPTKTGTTTSLRLSASHAIWPGNAITSSTTTVSFFAAAVPHTPRPKWISWQAGFP